MANSADNQPECSESSAQARVEFARFIGIVQGFVHDVQQHFPGRVAFLQAGDTDSEGADFGFYLEVAASEYERALEETSRLETEFYNRHGLNFVVIPQVLAYQ